MKAIIIGAGIAGIATAIRLAVKGYNVEVFEANAYAGGKLSEIELNGYRFDAGPSLFTMPQYVDELFTLAGKPNPFKYQKLEVVCQYFYEDGTKLTAYADEDKFAGEVAQITNESAENVKRFFKHSRAIYNITNHVFLERSLHRLKTFLSWDTVKSIFRFGKIDAFRTMHQANEAFFKDKHMVQFFDRYATYNGSNPYRAPGTLNVIPHLEQHFGAYFPDGGMYNITKSLVALAEILGVKFNYNSRVNYIILENKKVTGITVTHTTIADEFHAADVVVSNMDVYFTYQKLLKAYPELQPKKILKQERSSSALIFYWGISKTFPQLDLHNIFLVLTIRPSLMPFGNSKPLPPILRFTSTSVQN
jgi:phytoene desaturase